MLFPKITYNKKELGEDDFLKELSSDAIYSSIGIIWMRKPSIKWLIHEYLHHLGYGLGLPLWFHRIIHKVF